MSKSPSKYRTFSQTSSPAHPAACSPWLGPGPSAASQGGRWSPGPTGCVFIFIPRGASLTPETAQHWGTEGLQSQRGELSRWRWLLALRAQALTLTTWASRILVTFALFGEQEEHGGVLPGRAFLSAALRGEG